MPISSSQPAPLPLISTRWRVRSRVQDPSSAHVKKINKPQEEVEEEECQQLEYLTYSFSVSRKDSTKTPTSQSDYTYKFSRKLSHQSYIDPLLNSLPHRKKFLSTEA